MDLYTLLRRFIQYSPMSETDKADAGALIDRLQEVSALGTLTGRTEGQAHDCYFPPLSNQCIYCHKERSR